MAKSTRRRDTEAGTLSGREIGEKVLQAIREMKAGKVVSVTRIRGQVNEVIAAREKTGLTQKEFAQALSISPRTVQEWEQGRRTPSGAAKVLIRIEIGRAHV